MKYIRKMFIMAEKRGWIQKSENPFNFYKIDYDPTPVAFLKIDQIKKFEEMENIKPGNLIEFIKTIKPLPLESYDTNEFVKFLIDFHKKRGMLDELTSIYENAKLNKERQDIIDVIGGDTTFETEEKFEL